jgi:hypothetical protein
MPSKSKAQHNLMAAVANNPKFAKKAGIPQTVGADYMKADKKVMKYNMGGMANAKKTMRNLDDEVYRIDTEKTMERRKMNSMKAGGKIRGYGMVRGGLGIPLVMG